MWAILFSQLFQLYHLIYTSFSSVFSEDGINTVLPESVAEDEGDKEVLINVGKFCQWLTGQAHIPLSHADREGFSITIEFDHDCQVRFGTHSICYPIVNACSCSVTFPVAHLTTQEEFRRVIAQAITYGYDFGRSWITVEWYWSPDWRHVLVVIIEICLIVKLNILYWHCLSSQSFWLSAK